MLNQVVTIEPSFYFTFYYQSAGDFGKGILEDLHLNLTTLNLLKPGEPDAENINSHVMSFAIMSDSFGVLNAAHKRARRQGNQVTGPSLEKALRKVCIFWHSCQNNVTLCLMGAKHLV